MLQKYGTLYEDISIHAPTRGATCNSKAMEGDKKNFNPRSYKRSDCMDVSAGML